MWTGVGVDQGFTRAEHSYCVEYKAGGVGGVGGHEKKGWRLRNVKNKTSRESPVPRRDRYRLRRQCC